MNKTVPFFAQRKVRIAVFAAAVFLYWASLYLYVPTLPVYVETKVADLAKVGVVLSMYGLWQMLIRLPVGITSDWLGKRKPFILGGFLLAAAGALLMGYAGDYFGLAAGRAITGLAAATWVPLTVAFSALFKPHEAVRATALLTMVNSVSRMLATGLTGTLNQAGGYRLAFLLAAAAAGLAVLVMLPDREPTLPQQAPSVAGILAVVRRRDVLLPSLLAAVAQYLTWTTTFGFLPILAERYGAGEIQLSLLTSMNIAIALAGNLLLTALLKRTGSRPLLYAGFGVAVGGVTLAALAPSLGWVFAAQACLGLGFGIAGPVLMGKSIEKVENARRSTAMGLHQSVYAIGMFTGPWLSGLLADAIGLQPMFTVTAAAGLALGGIGLHFLRK